MKKAVIEFFDGSFVVHPKLLFEEIEQLGPVRRSGSENDKSLAPHHEYFDEISVITFEKPVFSLDQPDQIDAYARDIAYVMGAHYIEVIIPEPDILVE